MFDRRHTVSGRLRTATLGVCRETFLTGSGGLDGLRLRVAPMQGLRIPADGADALMRIRAWMKIYCDLSWRRVEVC